MSETQFEEWLTETDITMPDVIAGEEELLHDALWAAWSACETAAAGTGSGGDLHQAISAAIENYRDISEKGMLDHPSRHGDDLVLAIETSVNRAMGRESNEALKVERRKVAVAEVLSYFAKTGMPTTEGVVDAIIKECQG